PRPRSGLCTGRLHRRQQPGLRPLADPQRRIAGIDRPTEPSPVDRQRPRPRRRGTGQCRQRWL
ncbi:hypothetical protein SM139_1880, partial [Stenotrophomonas maltophilia]